MKRLRARLDIYVDLDELEGDEEEKVAEAKGYIEDIIDCVNRENIEGDSPASASEIIQFEIYDEN